MLRRLIIKNSTTSFIVLAFAFSYSVGTATLWIAGAWLRPLSHLAATYVGVSGVVFGPAVAALVVTCISTGRAGVIGVLSRLKIGRGDLLWIAVLPTFSLATTVVAFMATGTARSALAHALAQGWGTLLLHYLLQFLIVGIGEELGWRGWLLPRLLKVHTRAGATLLVAAIWWAWHLPKLLSGVKTAAALAIAALALSFLFTALWSYARGSVLVVALAHASHNAPVFFFEAALGFERTQPAWLMTSVLYAFLAAVLVALTLRWWRMQPVVTPAAGGPVASTAA